MTSSIDGVTIGIELARIGDGSMMVDLPPKSIGLMKDSTRAYVQWN